METLAGKISSISQKSIIDRINISAFYHQYSFMLNFLLSQYVFIYIEYNKYNVLICHYLLYLHYITAESGINHT